MLVFQNILRTYYINDPLKFIDYIIHPIQPN